MPADLADLPPHMSPVIRPWADRRRDALALWPRATASAPTRSSPRRSMPGRTHSAQGIRSGDRVMLADENSVARALLVLALGEADAWPLVANARLSAPELQAIQAHSGARRVLYTSAASADAARHAAAAGAQAVDWPGAGALHLGQLHADTRPEPMQADGAAQVGALIGTSGTTGGPKGVMLSHGSVLFSAAVGGGLRGMGPGDRVYGVPPMSHIAGLSSVLIGTRMFGAALDLVPRSDAGATLRALGQRGITRLQGVPTPYQRLLEAAGGRSIEAPALRSLGVAGAPPDPTLKAAVEQAFGLPLRNGHGITKCAPTIAFTHPDDPRPDVSVGPPIPGIKVRLTSPAGAPVEAGAAGELQVRGPNVMLGCYRAPDQTAAVLDGQGWFSTGDLARLDGPYLHIVGRKLPANEEVIAFVQLKPGAAATPAELNAFAAERLAPYKRPAELHIHPALPATSAGEILKHQLAQLAQHPQETCHDGA
jgi:acyl-CoA synthetase (AMP-forming)/AMP-acid ligase II